jgi:hypothetical protein
MKIITLHTRVANASAEVSTGSIFVCLLVDIVVIVLGKYKNFCGNIGGLSVIFLFQGKNH